MIDKPNKFGEKDAIIKRYNSSLLEVNPRIKKIIKETDYVILTKVKVKDYKKPPTIENLASLEGFKHLRSTKISLKKLLRNQWNYRRFLEGVHPGRHYYITPLNGTKTRLDETFASVTRIYKVNDLNQRINIWRIDIVDGYPAMEHAELALLYSSKAFMLRFNYKKKTDVKTSFENRQKLIKMVNY